MLNCPNCDKPLTDLGDGEHWCGGCVAIWALYDLEDGAAVNQIELQTKQG